MRGLPLRAPPPTPRRWCPCRWCRLPVRYARHAADGRGGSAAPRCARIREQPGGDGPAPRKRPRTSGWPVARWVLQVLVEAGTERLQHGAVRAQLLALGLDDGGRGPLDELLVGKLA